MMCPGVPWCTHPHLCQYLCRLIAVTCTASCGLIVLARVLCTCNHLHTHPLRSSPPPPDVFSKFRTAHPAEDCLVGNWVGRGRWALVDLTAGGFDWGPALGGEGVVGRHSLPSVMERFSALAALRQGAARGMCVLCCFLCCLCGWLGIVRVLWLAVVFVCPCASPAVRAGSPRLRWAVCRWCVWRG